MVVYITRDVKQALNAYRKALRKYPISRDRIHEKYNNMVNMLLLLGNDQSRLRPCMHKKLGQRFSSTNEPILKNLYRFNYSDESKFQWSFGVVIDKLNNQITITKMIPASFVTENRVYNDYIKIQNTMKQRIRLTEGDLHRIIRNCVNEALDELDMRTKASYALGRDLQGRGLRPLSQAQQRKNTLPVELSLKGSSAQQDAANDWNQEYGDKNHYMNAYDNYAITSNDKMFWHGDPMHSNEFSSMDRKRVYYPHDDIKTYDSQRNGKRISRDFIPNYSHELVCGEGESVARQMANPNPRRDYVKGRGWNKWD